MKRTTNNILRNNKVKNEQNKAELWTLKTNKWFIIKCGPTGCLPMGLNVAFHYECSHWQPKDELLQAKSRRREAAGSRGEGLVMLKAQREERRKDRGAPAGWRISHSHRSNSDPFSCFVLISFAFPFLPHTVSGVIVQWLGSASQWHLTGGLWN